MKKRKIITIVTLLLISLSAICWYLYFYKDKKFTKQWFIQNIKKFTKSWSWSSTWEITNQNDPWFDEKTVKEKIEFLRKKIKLKWLIDSWNNFLESQYYIFALNDYLKASSEDPKDKSIVNKIANTYFLMKNFSRSYGYYKQISDYDKLNKDDVMLSLIYSREITKESKQYLFDQIDYFKLWEEKTFYYKTSINCVEDLHRCKQIFMDYIAQKDKLGLKIETKEIQDIKNAFINYDNFKVNDLAYKNALLIWVFLENKLYPVAIWLWKKLLIEKPNYKSIIQIIWKSYFELWKYREAKKYLTDYLELEIDNKDVVYLLWIINSELKEYVLSNIYLKSAMDKWYSPTINLRRRMLYNFWELWENKKMMENFKELIEKEPKLERNDLYLYIYYSIVNKNLDEAERIAKKWVELFKDDDNFYGYLWWINKEKWNNIDSEKYLLKWLDLNSKNAMINLYLWNLELEKTNYSKALLYFKKTVTYDKTWDFSSVAEEKLKEVEEKMKLQNEEEKK